MRGRDIKRYGYVKSGLWLIATFPSRHYDIENYPALKSYLLSYGKEKLEQTGKRYNVNGYEVIARKKTNNKWFETQDSISYWEDFSQPKIIWGEISDKAKFFLDREGKFYCEATTFLLLGEQLEYLICYLNSRLAEFLFSIIGTTTGVGTIRWKKYKILDLMVPQIGDDSYLLIKRNYQKYEKENDAKYLLNIEKIIYDEFSLSSLEIDYIENRVKQFGE